MRDGVDASLRPVRPADAADIRDIYAPYVRETVVTFEQDPPSIGDIGDRIASTVPDYPWLVCETTADGDADGDVLGYAYAGALRKRAAYQWAVESSVYVDRDRRGEGIGRALYTALLGCLEAQGYLDAYAVIAVPNPESVGFHESMGFDRAASFEEMGYKHGEWVDIEWWRRPLAGEEDRPGEPAPPLTTVDARERAEWDAAIERGESVLP